LARLALGLSLQPQCRTTLFLSWLRQSSITFPHLQRHLYTSGCGEEMIVSIPDFLSESDTRKSPLLPGSVMAGFAEKKRLEAEASNYTTSGEFSITRSELVSECLIPR
jgi:hypothetical protein